MNADRRQYLDAIGVRQWVRRDWCEADGGSGPAIGQPPERPAARPAEPPADQPLESSAGAAVSAVPPADALPSQSLPAEAASAGAVADIRQSGPSAAVVAPPPAVDWPTLQANVAACCQCELHRSRTQTVFGVGDADADWMLIGEAPGADEDRLGEPFVGRSGKLLDQMLLAVGFSRERVFIANTLKCRPPNNRDPLPAESACCRPWLEQQIALVQPRVIMAVGGVAAKNLLGTDEAIGALRGRVHQYRGIPLVVGYHPAYLLRSPSQKRKAWDDLLLVRRVLEAAQ